MSDKNVGMIFDIQSYSVHDGPGCRTNVFFVGCPLQCRWCANPEGWRPKRHLMFSENRCKGHTGCQACKNACAKGAISFSESGKAAVDWSLCSDCETIECVTSCPENALKQVVRLMTVEELMRILVRDSANWGAGGGVTFTGGEPLMHADFLDQVLDRCVEENISCAIETSGYAPQETFLKIFSRLSFAFVDVKNMDDEAHRWGTGVSNKRTLANISALARSDWGGRLVLRTPTIHGFNDSTENALKVIDFMHENDLVEINLLKFHKLGQTKWEQLGKVYEYADGHGAMTDDRMSELQQLYLDHDIACYVGDDTPF